MFANFLATLPGQAPCFAKLSATTESLTNTPRNKLISATVECFIRFLPEELRFQVLLLRKDTPPIEHADEPQCEEEEGGESEELEEHEEELCDTEHEQEDECETPRWNAPGEPSEKAQAEAEAQNDEGEGEDEVEEEGKAESDDIIVGDYRPSVDQGPSEDIEKDHTCEALVALLPALPYTPAYRLHVGR